MENKIIQSSNVVKFLIRGENWKEEIERILLPTPDETGDNIEVIEYAYGHEHENHTPHTHLVIRINKRIKNNTEYLRNVWELSEHPNIQDIRLGDSFEEAANYACKSGIYTWPTQEIYPPYDIKNPEWNPMQSKILKELEKQNHREILYVVEKGGNTGKTFLVNWMERRFLASSITITNNYRDALRQIHNIRKTKNISIIFVDIPKAYPKRDLNMLFAALESIKDGNVADDRYHYRSSHIPSPKLCIMSNHTPNIDYLTKDRWHIMEAADENHIEIYDAKSYQKLLEMREKQEKARQQNIEKCRRYYEKKKVKRCEENVTPVLKRCETQLTKSTENDANRKTT